MSENKIDDIEDWYAFWSSQYPTYTFIDEDGSLSKGEHFQFNKIEEIFYTHEESDSWDWKGEALVCLKDGNFAYLTAWSETTFDGTDHFIAKSLETLFKYAMTSNEEKAIREVL